MSYQPNSIKKYILMRCIDVLRKKVFLAMNAMKMFTNHQSMIFGEMI